jgi:hypothetical protein
MVVTDKPAFSVPTDCASLYTHRRVPFLLDAHSLPLNRSFHQLYEKLFYIARISACISFA